MDLEQLCFSSSMDPSNEEEARSIFVQMLKAVLSVASQGLCHHDIKLENFVVTADRVVKLIDFAFAFSLTDRLWSTKSGKIPGGYDAGTFVYSSPQILDAEDHSGASTDVFALGVCLYRLLFKRFPFGDTEECVRRGLDSDLTFPDDAASSSVSESAKELLRGMLAHSEDDRFGFLEIAAHSWTIGPPSPSSPLLIRKIDLKM